MRKLILIFLFIPLLSNSQDLAGFWKGKIYQDSGGYAQEYELELQITQNKNKLYGTSNAYLNLVITEQIAFKGGYFKNDSIKLKEYEEGIINSVQPNSYVPCIKTYILAYTKEADGTETLKGRWYGVGYDDNKTDDVFSSDCIPGLVFLSRVSLSPRQNIISGPTLTYNFPDTLNGTKLTKVKEIEVENPVVEISINDYEKVDGDEVSIYFNREKIADHVMVKKSPTNFTLTLSEKYINNEIIIVAENLGRIPPNTSLMKIKDGNKTYEVYVSSDFKNSAAIYLKYKK